MVKKFAEGVNQLLHDRSFGEYRVLKMMSDLFALHGIVESAGGFLEASSWPSLVCAHSFSAVSSVYLFIQQSVCLSVCVFMLCHSFSVEF